MKTTIKYLPVKITTVIILLFLSLLSSSARNNANLPLRGTKHLSYWEDENARNSVQIIYTRIFGREVDAKGMSTWTNRLKAGQSLQDVLIGIVTSKEYQTRFIDPYHSKQFWGDIIKKVYKQLLDRDPESTQVMINHSKGLRNNWKQWITSIINSKEYNSKWGTNGVPGVGYNLPGPGNNIQPSKGNSNKVKPYEICVTNPTSGSSVTLKWFGSSAASAAEDYNKYIFETTTKQSGIPSDKAVAEACK